jgi:hypothetical protein
MQRGRVMQMMHIWLHLFRICFPGVGKIAPQNNYDSTICNLVISRCVEKHFVDPVTSE